jgi:hypothetical protein
VRDHCAKKKKFGLHKRRGVYFLSERLLASQERPCSMKSVTKEMLLGTSSITADVNVPLFPSVQTDGML